MSASKAQQAKTAKRRAQAIALKLAGMDFETIAEAAARRRRTLPATHDLRRSPPCRAAIAWADECLPTLDDIDHSRQEHAE
jgi:hypothetical protein